MLSCARAMPHTIFHLVGGGTEKEKIAQEIAMTRTKNVIVHGIKSQDEIDEIAKTCCVTLVPSRLLDNFPNVVLESYMRSLPVVGSNNGGIPEMIEEGHTGFICKNFETHEYVSAIQKAQNDANRMMGNNARLAAEVKYHTDKIIPRIIKLYEQTIHLKSL